jgi:hypothetical protein
VKAQRRAQVRANAHRGEAELLLARAHHEHAVAVLRAIVALRVRLLLDGRHKVAAHRRAHHVPQRRLPEGDLALLDGHAGRHERVDERKGRRDRGLEEGDAQAAQVVARALAAVGPLAHPPVHAVQHGRLVPRRVGARLLAVQHAAHRVARDRGARVVRVVEVVVPRRLPLDDLGVRRALLAQLVPRAHDAVQP